MEIRGKVINILPRQTFVSSRNGNEFVFYTFILETQGEYPKKIAMQVDGDERFAKMNLMVGNIYDVSFDVESREWNGKWFTKCAAWKTALVEVTQAPPTQEMPQRPQEAIQAPKYEAPKQQSTNNNGNNVDDQLPF